MPIEIKFSDNAQANITSAVTAVARELAREMDISQLDTLVLRVRLTREPKGTKMEMAVVGDRVAQAGLELEHHFGII